MVSQLERGPPNSGRLCLSILVLVAFVSIISTATVESSPPNRRSARAQRQVVLDELATGLTGTGTSFNSYGRNWWQQQQQQTTGYDDIPDSPFAGRYPDRNGYPTGGYGGYGAAGGGPSTNSGSAYGGYGGSAGDTYGSGLGGYGAGKGGAGGSWRGFGGGGYGGGGGGGKGGGGYTNNNRNRFGTKY